LKVSKSEKIEALERILKALLSWEYSDYDIEYYKVGDIIAVRVHDIDLDKMARWISCLNTDEIGVTFMTSYKESRSPITRKKMIEPIVTAEISVFPQYWRHVEELKKEIKELKERLRKMSENEPRQ